LTLDQYVFRAARGTLFFNNSLQGKQTELLARKIAQSPIFRALSGPVVHHTENNIDIYPAVL